MTFIILCNRKTFQLVLFDSFIVRIIYLSRICDKMSDYGKTKKNPERFARATRY
jgi:hypothetical protein